MQKIKVLQVNKLYYPEIGGIEKTLQQISEGLQAQEDVELKVLVCQKKGRSQIEHVNGVEVHRAGSLGVVASVPISIPFLFQLRKMAKEQDVIQFHLPFPLGDLGCLLSGYKGKVVAFWHSDVVKQKKWMIFYRPVMELFLKRADLILVGAQGIVEGSKYLGPYREKCRVVPFAVTDDILQDGTAFLQTNGYKKKTEKLNFLFVGRLVYYKGCSVLLEAFEKMDSDATLTIIGEGPLREELEQRVVEKELTNRINLLGKVDNEIMKQCMRNADVFVLPSTERSEAFGLVQLEAMTYGTPVINTNLPSGVPEVSIHGRTGLTVEPGDVQGLKEAMLWMTEHGAEREAMGIAARKRLEEWYTERIMVSSIKKIYKELCEKV